MKSSLQTLTRIQKFQIDEQRKILNEYLAKEEKILNDLKRMFLEYEKEKEFAAGQVMSAISELIQSAGCNIKMRWNRRLRACVKKLPKSGMLFPICLKNKRLMKLSTKTEKSVKKKKKN